MIEEYRGAALYVSTRSCPVNLGSALLHPWNDHFTAKKIILSLNIGQSSAPS